MADPYDVGMSNATVVANATLIIVHSATGVNRGSILEVLRITVTQQGTATSQQLGVIVGQKASAFGTYVSATPSPSTIGGAASGITGGTAGAAGNAGVNASAEGAGTVTNYFAEGFNNLNGFLWVPVPEERLIVPPDTAVIVKLVGTPTTLTGWNANLTYMELN